MQPTPANLVPCVPETAPFTPEQRAYLNGFLAGLFSRQADPGNGPSQPAISGPPLMTLSILFGSQTGTAEMLSKRLAKEAGKRGFAPTVHSLAKYPISQLASEERVLIVTSTFGDGEAPDNAKAFWDLLQGSGAPKLPNLKFSVCALGDSSYPKFCQFGASLDARLAVLGAQPIHPRTECDVDYDQPFAQWMNKALSALTGLVQESMVPRAEEAQASEPASTVFDRTNPFPASLVANRKLTGSGSEKDVRHFEIALDGSGLTYDAGDALGVYPSNCPALVDELILLQKYSGQESVPGRNGQQIPIREALLGHYEITRIPLSLLKAVSLRYTDERLKHLVAPDANGKLSQFLWGREIVDLLLEFPLTNMAPMEFVGLLRKLTPRLYSISSSPKAHPGQVHLTINVLRYQSLGRSRKGVCSTYLAERRAATEPVPVYVHHNPNFRPPATSDAPMIMVGPGTGIAPFRAFLHERRATGAKGKNWLFFGDQRAATDFLYQQDLVGLQKEGVLTHLDTCFSRDQAEKVYVQHRMKERAKELYGWLEEGAHFYVCGDANRMAKDVDAMLHEVVCIGSGRNQEQAADYIGTLKAQNRYVRDVY